MKWKSEVEEGIGGRVEVVVGRGSRKQREWKIEGVEGREVELEAEVVEFPVHPPRTSLKSQRSF